MAPFLSIVIPIFNEEANITNLWDRLKAVLDEQFNDPGKPWEVIFTDDGSRDNSLPMLQEIARSEPRTCVVEFNRNYGQHAAIFGAFAVARGEVVLVNGNFGLRVTEVAAPRKRLESIRCLF